jgi:hypothetical protein
MSEENRHPPFKTYLCPFCQQKQRVLAVSWQLVHAQALMHFDSCVHSGARRDPATVRAASEVADALAPQKS